MEPLSALGIATAVVQFLDFTANVVSGTHKIYVNSPDHAHRNIDLKQISTSLVTLNDEITNSLDTAHTQQRSVRDQQLDGLEGATNWAIDFLLRWSDSNPTASVLSGAVSV
jgi:hypothetical protein